MNNYLDLVLDLLNRIDVIYLRELFYNPAPNEHSNGLDRYLRTIGCQLDVNQEDASLGGC